MIDILIQIAAGLGGIVLGVVILCWLGKQPWWPNDGGP